METKFLTITISDPIYQGFTYKIPLDYALNVDKSTIVNEMKKYMKNFFGSHGLNRLQEGVDRLDLHLHQDINSINTEIYMCTHCAKLENQRKN
jgi:hypothetical protein